MKNFLAMLAFLMMAPATFGAIEFSEDAVQSSPESGDISAATAAGDATAAPASTTVSAIAAPVSQSQSSATTTLPASAVPLTVASGVSGGVGSSAGLNAGGGGGGGNGTNAEDAEAVVTADDPVSAADAGNIAAATGGSVSTPEPATAVVWSVLALCGIGLARFRRK